MAEIAISIRNEAVIAALKSLELKITDMTPAFKDIADLELSQTKIRFKNETDPDGKRWPDPFTLRPGTAWETGSGKRTKVGGWKREEAWGYVAASNFHAAPPGWRFFGRSRGDKVLRDTGTLFNSIGRAYDKNSAIVGTNQPYGKALQSGRFPFIGINQKTYDNIEKVVISYFLESKK